MYRDPEGARHLKSFDREVDAKTFLPAVVTDMARGEWRDPRGNVVPLIYVSQVSDCPANAHHLQLLLGPGRLVAETLLTPLNLKTAFV